MKKIIYYSQNDAENFDLDRFKSSLVKYAEIPEAELTSALETVAEYETLHVSRLVELGTSLIAKFGSQSAADEYFNAHAKYFGEGQFERLRRITGYLVGTLSRWNDAKQAEEKARVKHCVNSAIDDAARLAALETQAMNQNIAYAYTGR